jgi:hypothetical protein
MICKLKISIMKASIRVLSFLCFIAILVLACGKNISSNGSSKSTLTLSSQIVKIGQPLIVATSAAGTNLFTKWAVYPSANSSITSGTNQSVILFSKSGVYTITASYFTDSIAPLPYDSSSSQVTVSDSIYNDSTVARCTTVQQVPVNGNDLITLTPVSYSDSGTLTFLVHTQDTYGYYSPSFGFMSASSTGNGFSYTFTGVNEFPCSAANSAPTPATGTLVLSLFNTGTYSLSLTLNGVSYTGSLYTTSSECTITWNYSTGIIISPLVIQL